jgi:hypothetical protein
MAFHVKTDVFKQMMWFMYEGTSEFIPLTPDRVKEIMELNSQKVKPTDLKDFVKEVVVVSEPEYSNVVGQDSLNRFDTNFAKKKKNNSNKPRPQGPRNSEVSEPRRERTAPQPVAIKSERPKIETVVSKEKTVEQQTDNQSEVKNESTPHRKKNKRRPYKRPNKVKTDE